MRRTISRSAAALVIGALLTPLLIGCSPATRHQWLTFFFTGVPPLEGTEIVVSAPELPSAAPMQVRMGLTHRRPPEFWVHGPYAARDCDQCHMPGQPGVPRFQGIRPAELCAQCHTSFVAALDPSGDRWIHGPVASGDCTACHHPHRSPNRFMLRAEPGALCGQCHAEASVQQTPAHRQGEGACLNCHDPHSGATPALLSGNIVH
ncbi:MAG: cytochrome c3 family protein [Nitrospirota bacterium]|nr:cytochrome c3 family protein [Nitrospirota bacterium]